MVETLIWIYIVICLAMIFFDIAFLLVMSIKTMLERRAVKKIKWLIVEQIENVSQNKPIDNYHINFISQNLKFPVTLNRYDKALSLIRAEIEAGSFSLRNPEEITNVRIRMRDTTKNDEKRDSVRSKIAMILRPKKELIVSLPREVGDKYLRVYLRSVAEPVVKLTESYRRKDDIVETYYVHILKKYNLPRYFSNGELIANMKDLVEGGDVNSCEAALQTIYCTTDPKLIVDLLRIVDKKDKFIHPKIISDGLLSVKENADELRRELLGALNDFSFSMQVNILNYIRFSSGEHCEEIFRILVDDNTHDEVRFSAIRYFGRYRYEKAYPIIAELASGSTDRRIEYTVVAITALRNYPGEQTKAILLEKIRHNNWYVRYNASESLEMLGTQYEEIVDIFDGKDRFAREMMQYQFDQRYIENKEVIE